MKKIKLLAIAAVSALALLMTACQADDSSGKVTYTMGASTVEFEGMEALSAWATLESTYDAALKSVAGAKEIGQHEIEMYGSYKSCDEAVKNACKEAESRLTGKISFKGTIVMEAKATYWNGADTKVVYSKSWGN